MPEQNVSNRYIRRWRLRLLLETLFPDASDFNIRMKEEEWIFIVPRLVTEDELDTIQE
ncbi:hypothetical protein BDW74DRAFT_178111 [Aspergillus multicolor]|uniref:uncharacterized protein n=1 Tax=Aspergillus multicolor TaxID=41759 RepID=UPI003CCDA82C